MTEQDLLTLFDTAIEKGIAKTNDMSAGMSAPVVVHEVLREMQESIQVSLYELKEKKKREFEDGYDGWIHITDEMRVL